MSLAWLKVNALLGSIGKFAGASLLLASLGLTACGDDPVKAKVAHGCKLNSDCSSGLVCSFGLCHQQCEDSVADCAADQRCVQSGEGKANVCQLKVEAKCNFNSDCDNPLVCAIDRQCRNECQKDKDCLKGQSCVENICADAKEIDENGMLIFAGGAGNTPDETPKECDAGKACHPDGDLCKLGSVHCSAEGEATCEAEGDEDDGTECGTDQVCSAGACTDCVVGTECAADPDNTCLSGELSCANGPECMVSGNVKAGTSCGSDKVCDSGECLDCVVGSACSPKGEACKNGLLSCTKGPVCNATTNKDAGAECGTGKVCDSGGACAACVEGGDCAPENGCHKGTYECSKGPNCVDSTLPAVDGLACMGPSTYSFCTAGTCQACQNYNPCVPEGDLCHKGTLNCGTSPPTCNASTENAVDGLACGDNKSCISGACLTNDRVLTITSAAPVDVAVDNTFAAVAIKLVDKNGSPVAGAAVTVIAAPGSYASASAVTSGAGSAQIIGRVGRAVGSYKFTVSAPGATSADFVVKAVAPSAQSIFTLINVNNQNVAATAPGPGTTSSLYSQTRGLAVAKDGTVYLADNCTVYKLSLEGLLTRVAGGGGYTCGYSGDSGDALTAKLSSVYGLGLDETNKVLYIADFGNYAVRAVDLTNGTISTFAGGTSTAGNDPYGDGNPATAAYTSPSNLSVAPNGDVYISDYYTTNRIRKVSNGIMSTYLKPQACTSAPVVFNGCNYYTDGCSLAWDKDGVVFVSGSFCGTNYNTYFNGVARVNPDKTLTIVAGTTGSPAPAEGGVATKANFAEAPAIAFDKAGNLFMATRSEHRVRRIDSATQRITTVAGTGDDGFSGDYGAGNAAQVNNATDLAFDDAGHLYFTDAGNRAVRGVWGIGTSTASTCKLAITGGTGQSVSLDAPFTAFSVKATDGNDAAIPGVDVIWQRGQTGSTFANGLTTIKSSTLPTGGAAGVASMTGRVGLAKGDYTFTASYSDIHGVAATGSPQTFTVTATDPASGIIFPVVNIGHKSEVGGSPGPATFTKLQSYALGLAVDSRDGTMYVSDYSAVYKVTAAGETSVFAGIPGSYGLAGDSGAADKAKLQQPDALALDETNNVLYIADYYNYRVRSVTLGANPVINTFAGGGDTALTAGTMTATSAKLSYVTQVSVDASGKVYIPDQANNAIYVVDPTNGQMSIWLKGGPCVNGVVSFAGFQNTYTTTVRFKGSDAYVSGNICLGTGTTYANGIALKSGSTWSRIAGSTGTDQTDGIKALNAYIPDIGDFIIDANGVITITAHSTHKLRRIDASGNITTIAGDGTFGYAISDADPEPGAYVAATSARVYHPWQLAFTSGHLLVSDEYNQTVRMIW